MMNRNFTLQPALSHKKRLEEIRQMELAEIETAHERELHALELLTRLERLGYRELETQHETGELDIVNISLYLRDLQTLQGRIEGQTVHVEDLAEKARRKREELLEVSKEKKALEKLKEKHRKELALETDRAEDKALDDIATSQFHRRAAGKTPAPDSK